MLEFNKIKASDPELYDAVSAELSRQQNKIELIASENFVSEAVMETLGTPLTNKYAEGYPGKRYYGGCECVDVVENIAIERACKLFGADHANAVVGIKPTSITKHSRRLSIRIFIFVFISFLLSGRQDRMKP